MSDKSWSWDEVIHSDVMGVLVAPADDLLKWCNRLETAPTDAVVGKVLCVCGAVAIAQKLLANSPETTSIVNREHCLTIHFIGLLSAIGQD